MPVCSGEDWPRPRFVHRRRHRHGYNGDLVKKLYTKEVLVCTFEEKNIEIWKLDMVYHDEVAAWVQRVTSRLARDWSQSSQTTSCMRSSLTHLPIKLKC